MNDPIRLVIRTRNNRLMELREAMDWSVKETAARLGISLGLYYTYENLSRYPSPAHRQKICEFWNAEESELFPVYLTRVTKTKFNRTIPEEAVLLSLEEAPGELMLTDGTQDRDLLRRELRESLKTALHLLNRRERMIIAFRFGLMDDVEHTLDDVASRLDITRERVRQIEMKAIMKLRHPAISKDLKLFYEEEN